MNQHVDKAMELRNQTPMVNNCAQTIMRAYADELGMTEEQAAALGCNFGGGMKCGGHLWCHYQWSDGPGGYGCGFAHGSRRVPKTHGGYA